MNAFFPNEPKFESTITDEFLTDLDMMASQHQERNRQRAAEGFQGDDEGYEYE